MFTSSMMALRRRQQASILAGGSRLIHTIARAPSTITASEQPVLVYNSSEFKRKALLRKDGAQTSFL